MSKGALTRRAILEHAFSLASQVGLEGLSIGRLAQELELSKSGLFAHFQSKEALQLQVIDCAAENFTRHVALPTLRTGRGEPRVRALLENWLRWPEESGARGGCFFVAASVELDDRPGAPRDRLVQLQREWIDFLAQVARGAVTAGHFRDDLDVEQFAYDLYGVMLVTHQYRRLLGDPSAEQRARNALETLVRDAAAATAAHP
ncbi:MAG TPA: TetR/AcrR family transcriptional regulator [Longimicrobiaceae bacterium]|nr:TetR/AcrR family transcriptional regulator [Longimicrobiaceae bacterium]